MRVAKRNRLEIEAAILAAENSVVGGNPLPLPFRIDFLDLLAERFGELRLGADCVRKNEAATFEIRSQRLAFGPQRWGPQIVVGTLDGTLLVLNNRLSGEALQ